ncbi:hypothetical protein ACWENQ_26290 [Nonomuraea sp. NPDC004354]
MSNAVRHVLGVVAGLLLTPLLAVGLAFGAGQILFAFRTYTGPWWGALALAGTAIVLGFVAGSRLSPVASLLAGLTYTLMGVVLVMPWLYPSDLLLLLPDTLKYGFDVLGPTGMLLALGVMLVTVSAFPSRWRSARPELPPPPAPYGPPPQQPAYPSAFTPFQRPDRGDDDQTRPLPR